MEPNLTDDGPIDFPYIQKVMEENPKDWYEEDEAERRFDAIMKKEARQTGPCISTRDAPNGGFVVDIDFDNIVERSRP